MLSGAPGVVQKVRGKQTRKSIEMLGDLWARTQFPTSMSNEQAADWLKANGQEATPKSIAEMVDYSRHMDHFQFVPDPNEHLRVMDWKASGERLAELLEEWKNAPHADRAVEAVLWKRLSAARNSFTKRRKGYFATLEAERGAVKAHKEKLV